MKAISIKEPWASMINSGKKTIETRTWKTKHRGKLLLCCSKKPGVSILNGMAFATCDLVDIRPMTDEDEKAAQCENYDEKHRIVYSWFLENVKPITPFPVKGKLSLFEVEIPKKSKNII